MAELKNLKPYTLVGIHPISSNGLTEGRKGLQMVFAPLKPERGENGKYVLNNSRQGSRNFWGSFIGNPANGTEGKFKADPLFDQIVNLSTIPSNFEWETKVDAEGNKVTPPEFKHLLGNVEIQADVPTELVKQYEITDGKSVDKRRVEYTCVIVDGDGSKESVFDAQGHPMVKGLEKEEAEILAMEIAFNNGEAREQRRNSRIASGALKIRTADASLK